jgi:hypothetical protein
MKIKPVIEYCLLPTLSVIMFGSTEETSKLYDCMLKCSTEVLCDDLLLELSITLENRLEKIYKDKL